MSWERSATRRQPAAAAAKLKIGTRVTTVFAPERKGEMLDFWFEITG